MSALFHHQDQAEQPSSSQSDVQQAGSSLVIEIVALVTGGQTCSGALSENELI